MKWYPKAREGFLGGDIDIDTADLRVVLVDSTYVYSDAHQFLSDVAAGTRVATVASALTAVTKLNGTMDAADTSVAAVATGKTVVAAIVYANTGVDTTSRLLLYIDKAADGTTALSLPTNGGDINIQFHGSGIGDL